MSCTIVIGSNCFTGCHVVDALLSAGHRVVGVSRSAEYKPLFLPYKSNARVGNFEFRQGDMVKRFDELAKMIDELRPGVVVNVAALSEVALSNTRPVEYFETNTLAVVKLANHLRERDYLKRYVHISSAEIFGPCETALDESAPFYPSTPYAASKAGADMFLNTLIARFNFPATLIRSTNVYGRHQQLFKIVPRAAIYLKLGRQLELHGGGASMKSFIHVRDVVAGLMLALEKNAGGTFHLSVPSDRTIADVVRTVCKLMGRDFEKAVKVVGERPGQDSRYWLDCGRASAIWGGRRRWSSRPGVRETIEWVEGNWGTIKGETLDYVHKA